MCCKRSRFVGGNNDADANAGEEKAPSAGCRSVTFKGGTKPEPAPAPNPVPASDDDSEATCDDVWFAVSHGNQKADSNNIKKNFKGYLSHFKGYVYVDRDGVQCSCVGHAFKARVATANSPRKYYARLTRGSTDNKLCLDSGATSDMFKDRKCFGQDYRSVDGWFVFMGNGSKVKVAGVGSTQIKVHGKVLALPDSLHIPELEHNLLSLTTHAL